MCTYVWTFVCVRSCMYMYIQVPGTIACGVVAYGTKWYCVVSGGIPTKRIIMGNSINHCKNGNNLAYVITCLARILNLFGKSLTCFTREPNLFDKSA